MTITAEFNGIYYEGFYSYRVNRSVEDLSGAFEMTFSSSDPKDPRWWPGDSTVISVNGTPILTGFIDKRNITYGVDDHLITITGRDKVCDFVDSTVGANIELKAPVTLEQIVKLLMKEINMTGVSVTMNIGKKELEKFTQGELVSGQVDETMFSFLEKYTRKRQVLMTTDGKGGVVFARAGSKQASTKIIHSSDSPESNNVKTAEMDYDNSERFYLYRVWSQGNPSASTAIGTASTNHTLTNRVGKAYDKEIRQTRILDLTAESSSDFAVLQKRADWEANIRRIRAETYHVTMEGHSMLPGKAPWEPNMLVPVYDDFASLNDMMLIKSVEYTKAVGEGSQSKMELVSKDAYLPEPILTNAKSRHGQKGRKKGERKVYTQSDMSQYQKQVDAQQRKLQAALDKLNHKK